MSLNGNGGAICLQLFLIPKGVDHRQMMPFIQPFKSIQADFELADDTNIQNYLIPHEQHDEYSLGIATFFYDKKFEPPFYIVTAAKQQGFYSKLEIKRKHSR